MTIDYSKIKKAPAPQHLEFKYVNYEYKISAEEMAAACAGIREQRTEMDRLRAEQQRKAMEFLSTGAPPAHLFAGIDRAAPAPSLQGLASAERPTLSARLGHLKHGPAGSGLSGPCDADCRKCAAEAPPRPADPLDVRYDGVALRLLLDSEQTRQRTDRRAKPLTPAQRAAVSAHWSAELRAKVAAAKERERCRVLVDLQDEP